MTTTLVKADYKSLIHDIRGYKVMLDYDLAALYGVETKRLKESVRRNIDRFPEDFMIELNKEEFKSLRTQFVTQKEVTFSAGSCTRTPHQCKPLSFSKVTDFCLRRHL